MSTWVTRLVVFVSTVALAWGSLVVGTRGSGVTFQVGDIAARDYTARTGDEVLDEEAYIDAQEAAASEVEPEVRRDQDAERETFENVDTLYADVTAGVALAVPISQPSVDPVPSTTTTTTQPTTTTTVGDEEEPPTTTTTVPDEVVATTMSGFVFLDADSSGVFEQATDEVLTDAPLDGIEIVARASTGEVYRTTTTSDGTWTMSVPAGDYQVGLLRSDIDIPDDTQITNGAVKSVSCPDVGECEVEAFGLGPAVRPIETQMAELGGEYAVLEEDTISTLVSLATEDVLRRALGITPAIRLLETQTEQEISRRFTLEIDNQSELLAAQNDVKASPPFVFIDGNQSPAASAALGDIVSTFLVVNTEIDQIATEALIEEAMASVDPAEFEVEFGPDQLIIAAGQRFDRFTIDAITATNAADVQPVRQAAIAAVVMVLVASLGFYLSRFRRQFWDSPRMLGLFGLLVVMAAGSIRLTIEVQEQSSWFVLPAVAFGYFAAVLFDNRMGTLMSIAMGILAAVATRDPGVAVFAVLATLAPIGFVSRVSSRRAFRNAVVTSSLAVGLIAAAVAWLFLTPADATSDVILETIGLSVAWAIGTAAIASLVALAAMPFFESIFDITTTLRLLEVIDRNHEGLQLLQEKAFGSFNHSLMVGTLADAAARAIDANNLLARAAAYYHDLGKTENPLYFIENQFGVSNPHDELEPEESAAIIRRHVIDGMTLAKRYKIPSEVAEGIVTHHGDGIMRYFYEKARTDRGEDNVDPVDFRHAGHKPQSREMAIVMMADSVEGACRAVFEREEPSTEGIEKVVTRVIDEKLADGQLQECDLTMGELTKVKRAFIEALAGHYHRRIAYPNFPGS